jgi:outer membrane receptor for Fe3+-dicitrate
LNFTQNTIEVDGLNAGQTQLDGAHSRIPARFSPEWYATPQKVDLDLGTTWNTATSSLNNPVRYHSKASVSYVTGSHSLKLGGVWDFGHFNTGADANADLIQQYRSGVPTSVLVLNTPRLYNNICTLGALFVQEAWTLRRFTFNPGLRFEYLNQGYAAQTNAAGRFVGVRSYTRVDGLPTWKTLSPRIGAAYDLFGNAKTAVKFSLKAGSTTR